MDIKKEAQRFPLWGNKYMWERSGVGLGTSECSGSSFIPLFSPLFFLQSVVRKIEGTKVSGSTPVEPCVIVDSGVIDVDVPFEVEKKPAPEDS